MLGERQGRAVGGTRPFVLGLVGATGSGKSTLAKRLVANHGFVNLHMGRPLKDMLRVLGLSEEDVAGTPDQRARPQPLLGGKSARQALSSLGTDWGRNMITPDIWANAVKLRIGYHFENDRTAPPVVIDDLRFPNDWLVVSDFGGVIVRVRRPEIERQRTRIDIAYHRSGLGRALRGRGILGWTPIHETEFHWPDAPSGHDLMNTGSIDALVTQTLAHLDQIGVVPATIPFSRKD